MQNSFKVQGDFENGLSVIEGHEVLRKASVCHWQRFCDLKFNMFNTRKIEILD